MSEAMDKTNIFIKPGKAHSCGHRVMASDNFCGGCGGCLQADMGKEPYTFGELHDRDATFRAIEQEAIYGILSLLGASDKTGRSREFYSAIHRVFKQFREMLDHADFRVRTLGQPMRDATSTTPPHVGLPAPPPQAHGCPKCGSLDVARENVHDAVGLYVGVKKSCLQCGRVEFPIGDFKDRKMAPERN